VGSRDQSCDIEKLNGYGASSIHACAVVRFASVGNVVPGTGAVDLQVSNGALRIDRCEPSVCSVDDRVDNGALALTESYLIFCELEFLRRRGNFTHQLWMKHQSSYSKWYSYHSRAFRPSQLMDLEASCDQVDQAQ
jgi:hypothetical protein